MKAGDVLRKLKSLHNPKNVAGMARFGINPKNTYGIPIPVLRRMAREIGRDHALAQELWESGVHEARILAGMVDDPALVTERQLVRWAEDFDSWDVCDQVCMNLFRYTSFAFVQCRELCRREEEFVKRTSFALMAALASGDKTAPDSEFVRFLPLIKRAATDERNFVRKAVNWALRGIGKRNRNLNRRALAAAKELLLKDSKSARWIASDAIRELESDAVQKRLAYSMRERQKSI